MGFGFRVNSRFRLWNLMPSTAWISMSWSASSPNPSSLEEASREDCIDSAVEAAVMHLLLLWPCCRRSVLRS